MTLCVPRLHSFGQMNDGLERIWKGANFSQYRYYSGVCLEGLRNTTNSLSLNSGYPGRDSKGAPPECRRRELPLHYYQFRETVKYGRESRGALNQECAGEGHHQFTRDRPTCSVLVPLCFFLVRLTL
jgi:hypothetical protein